MPSFPPPQPHYDHGKVQPIDFMESFFTPAEYRGFLRGNIVKYISRYTQKAGLEDIGKAETYMKWLREFEEHEQQLKMSEPAPWLIGEAEPHNDGRVPR